MEGFKMLKSGTCLVEVELNDYLSGAISSERKEEIENHLKDCNVCLEKLVFAYEACKEFGDKSLKGVKPMKSIWKKNVWLVGALIAFTLSFIIHRYFVQLLVATILMGIKWIFDSVNARILIMIYDAWKKGDEEEASKIIRGMNDRLRR